MIGVELPVKREWAMNRMISEPITDTVDLSCRESRCQCERSVHANILADGSYRLAADAVTCDRCGHDVARHHIVGQTPSDYDLTQIRNAAGSISATNVQLNCSSCACETAYSGSLVVARAACDACGHPLRHHTVGQTGQVHVPNGVDITRRFY